MKKRRQANRASSKDPPVRPQLYISVMLVMFMLVLAVMGQWDWVLVVFIGLLVGNGFSAFQQR